MVESGAPDACDGVVVQVDDMRHTLHLVLPSPLQLPVKHRHHQEKMKKKASVECNEMKQAVNNNW